MVNDETKRSVLKSGGLPIGMLPLDSQYKLSGNSDAYTLSALEAENLDSVVGCVSGVILQGGMVSNGYEQHIARTCLKEDKPLLWI